MEPQAGGPGSPAAGGVPKRRPGGPGVPGPDGAPLPNRTVRVSALGAEVVWTRVLSLLFGATAYTFSLILAVFLVGLGIGSTVGAELARRV